MTETNKRKYEAIVILLRKAGGALEVEAADAIEDLLAFSGRMFKERRKMQEHNAELIVLLERMAQRKGL